MFASDGDGVGGVGGGGGKSGKRKKTPPADTGAESSASASVGTVNRPPPSRVTDEDGPTPEPEPFVPQLIETSKLEEEGFGYDPVNHPVSHQPWRRGETAGCEDPIDSQWRMEAESVIEVAAGNVGASVDCVTWYLTFVVVTLSNDLSRVRGRGRDDADPEFMGRPNGISIKVDTTTRATNVWTDAHNEDPNDPAGMPMGTFHGEEYARVGPEWADEDPDEEDGSGSERFDEVTGEPLEREDKPSREEAVFAYEKERRQRKEERGSRERYLRLPGNVEAHHIKDSVKRRYDGYQKGLEDYERVLVDKYGDLRNMTESELDGALKAANVYLWKMSPDRLQEFKGYLLEKFDPVAGMEGADRDVYDDEVRADGITDMYAKSLEVVADAILDALGEEDLDDRLNVLGRHELVLSSSSFHPRIVETQREFDAARGKDLSVQTKDPWNSNRVLKGKLVDRNSMDVIINVEGRMVTVPNSMVGYVYLLESEEDLRTKAEYEGIIDTVEQLEEGYAGFESGEEGAEDEEEEEGDWDEEEWDEDDEEEEYQEAE